MKHIEKLAILAVFLLFPLLPCVAAVGPDGADYTFGNWSAPEPLTVPSESGPLQLQRQTMTVTRRGQYPPYLATETKVALLMSPKVDRPWVGPEVSGYFVFSGRILGLYTGEGTVLISPGTFGVQSDLKQAVQKAVMNVGFSSLTGTHLNLKYVFGEEAIRPERDSRIFTHALTYRGAKVKPGLLELSFKSMVGRNLSVEYNNQFEVEAAYENGEPVLVLGNGRLPLVPWRSWPSEIDVTSADGALKALRCSMDFDINVSGRKHAEIVNVVAMKQDGTVWIGPDLCRLVVVGDQLVGIMRDNWMEPDRGELLVYASWGKIPVAYQGTTTAKGFQTALSNFNQQVQAKGLWGAFHLAKRIKLGELFPELAGTRALSDGCITIRSITFQGDAADILLESCQQWRVEVLLGPDLKVVGTHRLRWDHRPGQYTEVQKLP